MCISHNQWELDCGVYFLDHHTHFWIPNFDRNHDDCVLTELLRQTIHKLEIDDTKWNCTRHPIHHRMEDFCSHRIDQRNTFSLDTRQFHFLGRPRNSSAIWDDIHVIWDCFHTIGRSDWCIFDDPVDDERVDASPWLYNTNWSMSDSHTGDQWLPKFQWAVPCYGLLAT